MRASSTKSASSFFGEYNISIVTQNGIKCYEFVNKRNANDIKTVPVSEVKWGSNYETTNPHEIPTEGGKKIKGKSRSKRNRNKKTSKRRR